MLGIHRPSVLQVAVMLYLPFFSICPAGQDTLTTVPGVTSLVLAIRENATGRHSIATNEQSLHQVQQSLSLIHTGGGACRNYWGQNQDSVWLNSRFTALSLPPTIFLQRPSSLPTPPNDIHFESKSTTTSFCHSPVACKMLTLTEVKQDSTYRF